MRRRRKRTESTPKEELVNYGRKWLQAIKKGDRAAAMKARKQAEHFFKTNPKYRTEAPYCEKHLYFVWKKFANYLTNPKNNENIDI